MEKKDQIFWTNINRVIKAGFVGFWRNGSVSWSAVVVSVVTLFVIGFLLTSGALLQSSLKAIEDKVDINVYFVISASEDEILEMKKSLEQQPEVEKVQYVSRAEALENFKKRHETDQVTLQALEELGENPLGAVLNVKAKEASQYENVANFLNQQNATRAGESIIDKINYFDNKGAIDRLSKVIRSAERLGIIIAAIFILLSVMITYNTIRLAIYIAKDEISVMRLVGASRTYIRGPFVVSGILYGIFSALIVTVLMYPLTLWLGPITEDFFGELNVFDYYIRNFGQLFLVLLLSGVVIGAVSSYLSVRKYLSQ